MSGVEKMLRKCGPQTREQHCKVQKFGVVTLALLVVLSIGFAFAWFAAVLGVWEYLFRFVPLQRHQTGSRDVSSASSFPHQILTRPLFPTK